MIHPIQCGIPDPIPVIQLTKTGDFITEFPSICRAAAITGIDMSSIWQVISLLNRISAGGFIFIRKDKYNPRFNYSYEWLLKKSKFLRYVRTS